MPARPRRPHGVREQPPTGGPARPCGAPCLRRRRSVRCGGWPGRLHFVIRADHPLRLPTGRARDHPPREGGAGRRVRRGGAVGGGGVAGARVSREGAGYIWEWAGARLPLVRVRPQRRSPPRSSRASRPRRWRTAPWTWRAWVPCAHRPSSSVTARRSPSPAPCRPPPVLSLRALRGRAGGGLRRRGPRPGAGLAPRLSGAGGEGGGGGTGGPRLGRGRAPAVTAARSPAARRPLSPPPPPPPLRPPTWRAARTWRRPGPVLFPAPPARS